MGLHFKEHAMLFEYEVINKMPLIVHRHNIEGEDSFNEYIATDEGKKLSKPGDDRTPPWKWHIYLYHDEEHIVIPTENLMASLLFGGMKTTVEGKNKGTYKDMSQSGLLLHEEFLPILVPDRPVSFPAVHKLRDLKFAEQAKRVRDLGFSLYVKGVGRGTSRNIRVRPRFDQWRLKGHVEIVDPAISESALRSIFENSGLRAGLGDRRPGVMYPKTPGPFGTYYVKLKRAKAAA